MSILAQRNFVPSQIVLVALLGSGMLVGCAREEATSQAVAIGDHEDAAVASAPDAVARAPAAETRSLAAMDRRAAPADSEFHKPASLPMPEHRKEMLKPYTNLGPRESRYFDAKYLNSEALNALRKKEFNGEIEALANEAGADGIAKREAYTRVFLAALEQYEDHARLQSLNCGRVACMGSIRASNVDWLETIGEELRAGGLPMPSLAWEPVRLGSQYEVRFVFTTSGHGGFATRL